MLRLERAVRSVACTWLGSLCAWPLVKAVPVSHGPGETFAAHILAEQVTSAKHELILHEGG